jgi:membrane-associated phospholipid phosphatase
MRRKPLDINPGAQNIKIRAARLYSDVFSPPSLYAIFAFIIAWSVLPFWKGSLQAAIFGMLTSLMPLIYILIQIKHGKIKDLHISSPEERAVPYILGVVGAFLAYVVLRISGSPSLFLDFILTVIVGLGCLALINSRWLISAHTASITAVITFAGIYLNAKAAVLFSPLILVTVAARYYLKRHTYAELIAGALLGFTVVLSLTALGFFESQV